jgi:hypothetical protein
MGIDWAKCEKQTFTAKIKALQIPSGTDWGWVEFEGDTQRVKLAPDAPPKFSEKLEIGAEHEACVSVKESTYQGTTTHVGYLVQWGAPKAKTGGGRPGGNWMPRPESETLSIMSQVACKEARSFVDSHNLQKGAEGVWGIDEICTFTKKLTKAMVEACVESKGKLA